MYSTQHVIKLNDSNTIYEKKYLILSHNSQRQSIKRKNKIKYSIHSCEWRITELKKILEVLNKKTNEEKPKRQDS